ARCPRLVLKALELPRIHGCREWQHLERYTPAKGDLLRLVNNAHATPADFPQDTKVSEHATFWKGIALYIPERRPADARGLEVSQELDNRQDVSQNFTVFRMRSNECFRIQGVTGSELIFEILQQLIEDRVGFIGLLHVLHAVAHVLSSLTLTPSKRHRRPS